MKIFLTLFVFLMTVGSANAVEPLNPYGYWLTENERSVIKVEPCGKSLCGYIHWIIDGGMQYDTKNPQENLRGQPMCGLQIIQGLKPDANKEGSFSDGKIYKADDGDVYDASLTMKSNSELTVRGYMGISLLGKSQTWKRVSDANYPKCKAPKS